MAFISKYILYNKHGHRRDKKLLIAILCLLNRSRQFQSWYINSIACFMPSIRLWSTSKTLNLWTWLLVSRSCIKFLLASPLSAVGRGLYLMSGLTPGPDITGARDTGGSSWSVRRWGASGNMSLEESLTSSFLMYVCHHIGEWRHIIIHILVWTVQIPSLHNRLKDWSS